MLTLLGSLLGFMGSIFPEIIKLFQDRADKKHELTLMDKQIALQQLTGSQHLDEIGIKADISESQALYRTYTVGVKWVDALTASVRPVLTYLFFLRYLFVAYIVYQTADIHAPAFVFLETIWSDEDKALFACIISFWFGQRAMHKSRGK